LIPINNICYSLTVTMTTSISLVYYLASSPIVTEVVTVTVTSTCNGLYRLLDGEERR